MKINIELEKDENFSPLLFAEAIINSQLSHCTNDTIRNQRLLWLKQVSNYLFMEVDYLQEIGDGI